MFWTEASRSPKPVLLTTANDNPNGADALFQVGDRLRQKIARRVAGAGVVVAALLAKAPERKRRGQMDGRHHAAGGVVTFKTGTHGLGLLCRRRTD